MKIKITLADGKIIRGTRNFLDVFGDGWGNTVVHNAEIRSPEGALLSKSKIVKMTNRWIVMVEDDNVD